MNRDKWTGIRKGQGLRDMTEGEGQGDRESDRRQGLRAVLAYRSILRSRA